MCTLKETIFSHLHNFIFQDRVGFARLLMKSVCSIPFGFHHLDVRQISKKDCYVASHQWSILVFVYSIWRNRILAHGINICPRHIHAGRPQDVFLNTRIGRMEKNCL